MAQHKISIIMPICNVEKYLKNALQSIERQSIGLENLEVIMVNDGSADGCKEIMDSYAEKHSNFHAIHLPEPSGAAGRPRNVGMQVASGDYIMFLDPDDYYEDTACETLYNLITQYSADMGRGNFLAWSKMSSREHSNVKYFSSSITYVDKIDEFKSFYRLTPAVWASIFKRSFILENNLMFPEKIAGQDMVFVVNALLLAHGIFFTKTIVANYTVRDNEEKSVSNNLKLEYFQSMSEAQKLTHELFCRFNKEDDYSNLLFAHTPYYINRLIAAVDMSIENKIDVLKDFRWFFILVERLNAWPYDVKARYLIEMIIAEKFEDVIIIMKCFKQCSLSISYPNTIQTDKAQFELEKIYKMRSWKIIQKYRNFADNTVLGRLIAMILRGALKFKRNR